MDATLDADSEIRALREELAKERHTVAVLRVQLFEEFVPPQICSLAHKLTPPRSYSGFQTRLDEEVAEHDAKNLQKIDALERHLHETRELLAQRDANAETLLKKADEHALQSRMATQEREELRSELGREISNLRAQIGEMKHMLEDREVVSEGQLRKLDATQQELDAARKETTNVRSQMGETVEALRRDAVQLKNMLEQRELAQRKTDQLLDASVADCKAAREETERVRSELGSALAEERANAARELDQAKQVLDQTKELLAQRDANAETLLKKADEHALQSRMATQEREELRSELGREISSLRAQIGDMKHMLEDREMVSENQLRKLDATQQELEAARKEVNDVRSNMGADIDLARAQLGEAKQLLVDREHAAEALQRKCDATLRELDAARNETTNVRSQMGETVEALRRDAVQLKDMLEQRELAQRKTDELLDATAMDCKAAREETERVRSELGSALAEERAKAATLLDTLEAKNHAASELQAQLQTSMLQLQETRELLAQRDANAETLLRTADQAVLDFKRATQEREELRSELGREISSLRAQIGEMKHMLEDREVVSENQLRKLDAATAEVDGLRKELDAVRSGMGADIDLARAQLGEAKQLLVDREHAAEALQQRCDAALRELDAARGETTNVRSQMGETVEALRRDAVQLKDMLEQRELAQRKTDQLLDATATDCKAAREETERVRSELGSALAEERAKAATLLDTLEAKNRAAGELQSQLLVSKEALAQREGRVEDLLKSLEQAELETRRLVQERDDIRSDLSREISNLQARVGEMKHALDDWEKVSLSQLRELDAANAQVEALRKDLDSTRLSMGADIDSAQQQLAESKRELAHREQAAVVLQQSYDAARAETDAVRNQMREAMETLRRDAEEQLKNVVAERDLAKRGAEEQLSASAADCRAAREEVQRVRIALEEERANATALIDQLDTKTRAASELEIALEGTRELLAQRDANAETLLKNADRAVLDSKRATQEREELRSELGREISNLRAQIGEMKHMLEDREVVSEGQLRKLDAATAQVSALRKELDAVRSSMGADIDLARGQLGETKQLLVDREHAAEALQRKCDATLRELDAARNENANIRSQMGETLEELRHELAELREMLGQRELAQEASARAMDASVAECKSAREETERVRTELGNALAEERATAQEFKSMLEARNRAGESLQQQLDASMAETKKARKQMDDLRATHGGAVKDLRASHGTALKELNAKAEERAQTLEQQIAVLVSEKRELEAKLAPPPAPPAPQSPAALNRLVVGTVLALAPLMHVLEQKSRL